MNKIIRKFCGYKFLIFNIMIFILYVIINFYHYNIQKEFIFDGFYEIVNSFLVGFLISDIFYFMIIYLPSEKKRKMIKNNLKEFYKENKRDILREILHCSREGGRTDIDADEEQIEKLFNVEEFRKFFNSGRESNEGFYAFTNNIMENQENFHSLLFKFDLLAQQINFLLHNDAVLNILNEEDFYRFNRLILTILKLKEESNLPQYAYENAKIFSRFIWELFAGWSFTDGNLGYDPIEEMIEKI